MRIINNTFQRHFVRENNKASLIRLEPRARALCAFGPHADERQRSVFLLLVHLVLVIHMLLELSVYRLRYQPVNRRLLLQTSSVFNEFSEVVLKQESKKKFSETSLDV